MKNILISYIRSDNNIISLLIFQERETIKVKDINYISSNDKNINKNIDYLTKYIKENSSKIEEVIIIVSDSFFMIRNLDFPFKRFDQIKKAVPLEMGPELPVKENNLIYDFLLLNKSKNTSNILCFALQKDFIKSITKSITFDGIRFSIITIDTQCIISFLNNLKDLSNIVLLYVQENFINFFIKQENSYKFYKFYIQDNDDIALSLDKINVYLNNILPNGSNYKKIVIGFSDNNNFIELLKDRLKDDIIELSNLLKDHINLIIKGNLDDVSKNIILMGISLLRSKGYIVNFQKENYLSLKDVILNKNLKYYFIALTLILSLFSVDIGLKMYFLTKYNKQLTSRIDRIFKRNFPEIHRKLTIEQYLSVFRGKLKEFQNIVTNNLKTIDPLKVLMDISANIDENINIVVNELSFAGNKVIVRGVSNSLDDISNFRKNMKDNTSYKLNLKQANWEKTKKHIRFILEICVQ